MSIPKLEVGEIIAMKKKHPCGSFEFKVLRVGSDIKIACIGCSRELMLPRITLERMIKK